MKKAMIFTILGISITASVLNGCKKEEKTPEPAPVTTGTSADQKPVLPATPYPYKEVTVASYIASYISNHPATDNTPSDNSITNEGATLGRVLFYDKHLSGNNTIACASCHHQSKAFADSVPFSKGFTGGFTRRNSMTTVNVRYFPGKKMFWDLRAASLEVQTLKPITDHIEMGMASIPDLESKLQQLSYYPALFNAAFGSPDVTGDRISKALSQFVRSIVSFNSKYDKGTQNNFADFTSQELNGKQLFKQASCNECHSDLESSVQGSTDNFTFLITNSAFNYIANNGLDSVYTDNGVGEITNQAQDQAMFKIPSLRNIELTGPYMHDGRFATLEQVITFYNSGIKNHPNKGPQLPNHGYRFLSAQQQQDIVAFLKTLTDNTLISDPKYSNPFK